MLLLFVYMHWSFFVPIRWSLQDMVNGRLIHRLQRPCWASRGDGGGKREWPGVSAAGLASAVATATAASGGGGDAAPRPGAVATSADADAAVVTRAAAATASAAPASVWSLGSTSADGDGGGGGGGEDGGWWPPLPASGTGGWRSAGRDDATTGVGGVTKRLPGSVALTFLKQSSLTL